MAWNVGLRSNSAWIISKYMLTARVTIFFVISHYEYMISHR